MVIVILLSIFFARSIVNPIRKLSEIANQYGKLNALYSTIIFLQKEIKKEQDKLEQLKKKEEK